jgi:hypothetical protein
MDRDMGNEDANDRDVNRARRDPAPEYREDRNNGLPDDDPIKATDAPDYDPPPSLEEWMASADVEDVND